MRKRNYKRELKKFIKTVDAQNIDDILGYIQLRVSQVYEYYQSHRNEIKYSTWIKLEKTKKMLEKIPFPLYFPYDDYKEFSTKEPEKYQEYLLQKKEIVDAVQILLLLLVHIG